MNRVSPHIQLDALATHHFGVKPDNISPLKGDGSDRQIFRIAFPQNSTPSASVIGVVHQDLKENHAFLKLSQHFQTHQLPVPEVYEVSNDGTYYLMEDLGNQVLSDMIDQWNQSHPSKEGALIHAYQQVLYWLPQFQLKAHSNLQYDFCVEQTRMDATLYEQDLKYFQTYYWQCFHPQDAKIPEVQTELQDLVQSLVDVKEEGFVYRDFQSRNIMWTPNGPYFLDYQNGCIGSIYYDVASLLYASRAGLTQAQREQLIPSYLEALSEWMVLSEEEFYENFYVFVLIRRLRSLGSYGYLALQKQKRHFLDAIPKTLDEIHWLLSDKLHARQWTHLTLLFERWKSS